MNGLPKVKLGPLPPPPKPLSTKVEGVISPSKPNTSVKPGAVGTQATVKTPKSKKMADGFGKPSLFFKSEEFNGIKKASVENLRGFLERQRAKRNLSDR